MRYPAHVIVGSEFKAQTDIVQQSTLLASIGRDGDGHVSIQILQMDLAPTCDEDKISEIPWFEVKEVIATEMVGNHLRLTALVHNTHPLNAFGRSIWSASVAPGSTIGVGGAEIIIRGTPSGCQAMVNGFREWNPNATVSVVKLTENDELEEGLTSHQANAFRVAWRLGYYNRPRGCTLQDVAREVGVSRATVSGHLGAVEVRSHQQLAERLGLHSTESP